MSSITKHISIPKNITTKDDLDFFFLREVGIQYIEELGGELWTDLNTHDPGITILEALSYAITDLGNRIETPLENLLTSQNSSENIQNQFYRAEEVFPNKAVNELDYRKLFIDVDGVRNCWLREYKKEVHVNKKDDLLSYDADTFKGLHKDFKDKFSLQGLYTILVEFDNVKRLDETQKNNKIELIKTQIKKKFHQNRNLCEDLVEIKTVETQPVSVCANIEVEKEANEEEIHARVLFEIEKYFSPTVCFYSLKEMLNKGFTPDEIFDGPLLDNGFIDTNELIDADLRQEVRLSDLMKIIMNIEGVKLIKDISIGNCDEEKELKNDWVICIDRNKKPELCSKSAFSYHKGVLPLNINKNEVDKFVKLLEQDAAEAKDLARLDKILKLPKGTYSQVNSYQTILNDFPDTYGIGQEGLAAHATTQRKSQAKQLKSYLLFFDKVLASYFQHLDKVKDILSINGSQTKTFFSQALTGIKGFDELVGEYPATNEEITELVFDKFDNHIERRTQVIDHLLARFAENFGDYAFLMNMLYGSAADEVTLNSKQEFLKDYVTISSQRGSAFNYYKQPQEELWDTNNISGFQMRVSRLLGVKNYSRRHLTASFVNIKELIQDEKKRYEWNILDADSNALMTSEKKFKNRTAAIDAMYNVVLYIIQTSEEKILQKFEEGIDKSSIQTNINPIKTNDDKFTWNIINLEKEKNEEGYVLANHDTDYNTIDELKEKIVELINFIKHDFTEEGMFLVEHILLRPDITDDSAASDTFMPICADECEDCSIDPYSFMVSIVLPGYTYRFSNPDFRNYMENIIREELPAHIIPRVCWVGSRRGEVEDDKNDLWCFEEAYKEYLKAKTVLEQEQPIEGNNEHKKLIESMTKLNTIYQEGRLLDCEDETDEIEGKIILGQTNLGNLKIEDNGE